MKKILILGAGMVVKPIVTYLLNKGYSVTVATRTKSKADAMITGHPNGRSVAWTVDQEHELDQMIQQHDLTVSLLPYTHHLMVARKCLHFRKNMVTTSYVKPEMRALDEDAKKAGIIILNELGLDPGIDHMSAMRIIDHVHQKEGKVDEFYSFCGALVAPEVEVNPFHYKFTWAPKGVIMAGNNDGRYLRDGKEVYVPTEDLFKDPLQVMFPEVGLLDVYPNRDSLPYKDLYGISEVRTIFRGTFRYPGWCEIMDAMKRIGLLRDEKMNLEGMNYSDLMARRIGVRESTHIEQKVAAYLGVSADSRPVIAMEWLGLFEDKPINRAEDSPFEVVSDRMLAKMMIQPEERDMVVMLHTFLASYPNGEKEVIKSRMLDFGMLKTDTSVARTVALPAACGVEMVVEGRIKAKGVHIPVIPEIYNPILDSLESMNIRMEEEYGLSLAEGIRIGE